MASTYNGRIKLIKGIMSEKSLGEAINELSDVDKAMWNNQEVLYEIRRMTPQEFKEKYWKDEQGAERLWNILKKACDLNVERNVAMDAVDKKITKIITKEFCE